MNLDTLVADLEAHGACLVFDRSGKTALRGGPVPEEVVRWLKEHKDEVRRRYSTYTLLTYRLRSGQQLRRLLALPSNPPPPNATHWKWSHEPDSMFAEVTHAPQDR